MYLVYLQNEQLRQDVIDYQKQIDSQKETLLSRRGEDSDYRSQLSKKNYELVQYLDEIQVKWITVQGSASYKTLISL